MHGSRAADDLIKYGDRSGTFRTWRDVRHMSVMRSKAEVERHLNLDRAGNLLPCADRRCGVLELMIEEGTAKLSDPNGVALAHHE
jgi:hypothetical protein